MVTDRKERFDVTVLNEGVRRDPERAVARSEQFYRDQVEQVARRFSAGAEGKSGHPAGGAEQFGEDHHLPESAGGPSPAGNPDGFGVLGRLFPGEGRGASAGGWQQGSGDG